MNKLVFAAAICTVGLGACSQLREPTDQQLISLLRANTSAAAGGNTLLNGEAIDCLRALSGDKELIRGLSIRIAAETGVKGCRALLEGMVADAARNPAKLRLTDFSAPKTVRRAMALQVSNMNTRAEARPAPAPANAPVPAPTNAPVNTLAPQTNDVDLGASGAMLKDTEDLCGQVKEAAAQPDATDQLKTFASTCAANLGMLRARMQRAAKNGDDESLKTLTSTVGNILKAGHAAIGSGNQQQ
jgi:hypothetical protein